MHDWKPFLRAQQTTLRIRTGKALLRRNPRKIQFEREPERSEPPFTPIASTPLLPDTLSSPSKKILYCRCAFAQVVPSEVKNEVLEKLTESDTTFECVSDLCEMSARRDDRLHHLVKEGEPIQIAACYPRAVRWLFHAAGVSLPEDDSVEILNMREDDAETITSKLLKK